MACPPLREDNASEGEANKKHNDDKSTLRILSRYDYDPRVRFKTPDFSSSGYANRVVLEAKLALQSCIVESCPRTVPKVNCCHPSFSSAPGSSNHRCRGLHKLGG